MSRIAHRYITIHDSRLLFTIYDFTIHDYDLRAFTIHEFTNFPKAVTVARSWIPAALIIFGFIVEV